MLALSLDWRKLMFDFFSMDKQTKSKHRLQNMFLFIEEMIYDKMFLLFFRRFWFVVWFFNNWIYKAITYPPEVYVLFYVRCPK
jgi:hypothetical protein